MLRAGEVLDGFVIEWGHSLKAGNISVRMREEAGLGLVFEDSVMS